MNEGLPTISARYRIEREIGRGGMGEVYLAMDVSLERPVAIKLLRGAQVDSPIAIQRFLREGRVCAKLRSEHSVRVFDVGVTDAGHPYIVMECLEGRDLGALLKERGPLDTARALSLILQACSAIAEAHELDIVHRDLKPQNLFLSHGPRGLETLKVLDFGLSRLPQNTALTATGQLVGTPAYMSPEQITGGKIDARTDIWALGVILYELVSGKRPFGGATMAKKMQLISVEPHEPLRQHRPDASQELEAIIDRCLAKDPAKRYEDIDALARALAIVPLGHGLPMGEAMTARAPLVAPGIAPVVAPLFAATSSTTQTATLSPQSPFASRAPTEEPRAKSATSTMKDPSAHAPAQGGASPALGGLVPVVGVCVVALASLGVGGYALLTRSQAKPSGEREASADTNALHSEGELSMTSQTGEPLPTLATVVSSRPGTPATVALGVPALPAPLVTATALGTEIPRTDAASPESAPSAGAAFETSSWSTEFKLVAPYEVARVRPAVEPAVVSCASKNERALRTGMGALFKFGFGVNVSYDTTGTIEALGAQGAPNVDSILHACLRSSLVGKSLGPPPSPSGRREIYVVATPH